MSAQSVLVSDLFRVDEFIKRNDKELNYKLPKNYKGSPYLFEEFKKAKIYVNDTLKSEDYVVRYNIYSNEMELKRSLEDHDTLWKPLVKSPFVSISIEDALFSFLPFNGDLSKGKYFQTLYEGRKLSVLRTINMKYITPKKASSSITRDLKGAFTRSNTYLLVDRRGTFYEVPKRKKDITKLFGTKKEGVEGFIDKYELNLKKEKDLISVIKYYDNL